MKDSTVIRNDDKVLIIATTNDGEWYEIKKVKREEGTQTIIRLSKFEVLMLNELMMRNI